MNIAIVPVQVFPSTANRLWISDGWSNSLGSAPQFAYKLQNVVTTDSGETVMDLNYFNVSMTTDQWQNWGAGGDDAKYIADCIMKNLGLTRA